MNRADRLILWNQLEILKAQNPNQAADYDLQQDIVAHGYTTLYSDVFHCVTEDEASLLMQREVWETLDMFRALANAKQGGWVPSVPGREVFEGFDANNDEHYWFADYLLSKANLYQESAPNKNSHNVATVSRYRRMLTAWEAAVEKHKLTAAEAEAVLLA
ncbi:YfbU family protein [Pararhizobium qamdonense]|uniref:YfbU family protein n=1 Tax=Pararhizobium qamdonense TaxID=3031126 RepID=UPI0023E22A10|nr:YfbU family protein [Pararhizobium qamdonense]